MFQFFICATPYHILLSHLTVELLSQVKKESSINRILILTESAISDEIHEIIDKSIWQKILTLPHQKTLNFFKAKQFIDTWIKKNALKNIVEHKEVFINDDKRWRNQLLITGIKADRISLIEDGLGAYIHSPYPLRDRIYRGLILKSIFRSRLINIGPISTVHADRFYAFRENAYSWFGPNRDLHLLNYKNSLYIHKINKNPFIKKQINKLEGSQLIILTSPLIEDGALTITKEFSSWKKISLFFSHYEKISIKPHPREDKLLFKKRMKLLNEIFNRSSINIVDSGLPSEVLLCNDDINADIFSPNSTTLANLKSIRPDLNIYHGLDVFFNHKQPKDPLNSSAHFLNELGVSSSTEIKHIP